MKTIITLFFSLIFLFSYSQDLELELFASNFDRPVSIKHAGDDRLFVVEQDGRIKILNADGSVQSQLFLDIDNIVINTGNERGLLGLAFHPDFSNNGYFYVNYNNNSGNTVISRFGLQSGTDLGDPNSELIILTFNQPFGNHNGGDLAFGPDGYLYISSGDGGSGGDPQDNGQDTTNLLGKLLRIDVDSTTGTQNYSIPADNPFVGSPIDSPEIWAYGLRNPWKFSFDRMTGDVWIGDVGQGQIEEINMATPATANGLNYGWRCYEGSSVYNSSGCSAPGTYTFPVSEYNHSDGEFKCSITGGYRYRGSTYSNFDGLYFFADYCSGEIGFLRYQNSMWNLTFEDFPGNWVAFGEDVNGELLVSDIGGSIYKLTDALLSTDENQLNQISIFPNPAKNQFSIDFSNSNTTPSTVISIFDIQGKIIKSIHRNTETVQNISTAQLTSGIYILKIITENAEQKTHKLVIN